jgi:hypothetical protein
VMGKIVLDVSAKVLAENHKEALRKIYKMVNELNADFDNISVSTIDGKSHDLEIHNFHIEWEDVE